MCDNCGKNFNLGMNLPYFLPCGHTMCKICLDNIWEKNFNIKCPLDNYEKLGHIKYIKKNEYIISLLKRDDQTITERSNLLCFF